MYGGVTHDGSVSSQLWSLDLVTKEWILVTPSKNRECHHRMCGPVATTGHSAVLVKDKMYVIFGYNPIYGYLNILQEYSIGKKKTTECLCFNKENSCFIFSFGFHR